MRYSYIKNPENLQDATETTSKIRKHYKCLHCHEYVNLALGTVKRNYFKHENK